MERLLDTREADAPHLGVQPALEAPGLVLGRYRLRRAIGAGGHGSVWLAFDERLERDVAVKVMAHAGGQAGRRAAREARIAARLNHPGIVALYERGEDDRAVYLVSELVRGRTVAELEEEGMLSDRDVARVGAAVCDALAYAHGQGVVHRDVKPQNVIVAAEPAAGAGFAKLADFGVAHASSDESLTRTGDVLGTLAYMAPEQAAGERVTGAADVYALALVLYEAWTGVNPARDALVRPGRPRRPRPLERLRRDLPIALCREIDAALDARPDRRPSAAELGSTLSGSAGALSDADGLVEGGVLERVASGAGIPRRAGARSPVAGRLAPRAAAAVAAGALVACALELLGPPPPVSPLAAAAGAGAAVLLLPRAGWLAAAAGVCLWLAGAGEPGTALLVAAALVPTALSIPRAGVLWSAPALAPLLGAAGLAPAYVALAGLASTAWRRAALAAAGFGWLVVAELVSGSRLLLGAPEDVASPSAWRDSPVAAVADALYPVATSGPLLPLVIWVALAASLPLLVRGRSLAADLPSAVVWGVVLAAALTTVAGAIGGPARVGDPRGALAGAALGSVAAVATARARPRPRGIEAPTVP